jgi:uncharacterized membrane protein YfcA
VKLIFLIARGLILQQDTRRKTMFLAALVAMLMVFFGVVCSGALLENIGLFLVYWSACAWLALLLLLLALYDMLALRKKMREEQRRLKRAIFGSSIDKDHD